MENYGINFCTKTGPPGKLNMSTAKSNKCMDFPEGSSFSAYKVLVRFVLRRLDFKVKQTTFFDKLHKNVPI